MKKIVYYSIIIILGIGVVFTLMYEFGIPRVKSVTAVKSFGNQMNQQEFGYNDVVKRDWLYGAEWHNDIVKRQLTNHSKPETIYSTTGNWTPTNISTFNNWIYFAIEDMVEGGDVDLYRIREDGSDKKKLLNGGDDSGNYVLTKEGIVYLKNGSIYFMKLNGTFKRKIPIKNEEEEGMASNLGIDNGWIYYAGDKYIYRMKPDGSKKENISGKYDYVADQNVLYLVKSNEKMDKSYLFRKTINGKQTKMSEGSFYSFCCLNIEGGWLYYEDNNKVYKIKKTGEGEKELIYEVKKSEKVDSILLYDGDILISTNLKDVFIKKDGSAININ